MPNANQPPARILLVDDEPEILRALERSLRSQFELVLAETPQAALERMEKESFSVILSDQRMPSMTGTELLSRAATLCPLATRVILTAFTDSKEILESINRAEIYRYITKPWDNDELVTTVRQAVDHHQIRLQNKVLVEELEAKNKNLTLKEQELTALNQKLERLVEQRTAELRAANEKLSELAMTDPLTKIPNRRAFFMKFAEEIERSRRYRHPISLAMIDVDHFKSFNDMEGHVCGDEALRKVAQLFTSRLRKSDILGRYGGEEFVLMMPETPTSASIEICERLRKSIEENVFQGSAEPAYLTVSIGVATFPQHGKESDDIVKAADQALYQAKEFGRNRVVKAS